MFFAGPRRDGKFGSKVCSVKYSRNEFKPSSIQVHWRSSELTIIGKKLCPTSWMTTANIPYLTRSLYFPFSFGLPQFQQIIGYSMPWSSALTAPAVGYG